MIVDFINSIKVKAANNKKTIVLPEGRSRRVLEAASEISCEDVANIIVIGDRETAEAKVPDFDLDKVVFMHPSSFGRLGEMAETLYELRKHKGMTREEADLLVQDPSYFGMMLVKMGLADGLVAGAVHTTADTLRPALQILKTKPGTRLVSAYMLMIVPNSDKGSSGMFLMSDCALNVSPTPEELSEIALSSAESWIQLTGLEPRVAMLSYSTLGSGIGELPAKVAEATRLAREQAPDLRIDGEIQVDAAVSPFVAQVKAPDSVLQGSANCLIFPDLNAGNIGYKLVERLANAQAFGPMLQGIAKPVNDLSRGCSAKDVAGVIALTAVQAAAENSVMNGARRA